MPHLMAQAEEVDKLHAIRVRCGEEASRTQRIINGKPANYNDPIILVGARSLRGTLPPLSRSTGPSVGPVSPPHP